MTTVATLRKRSMTSAKRSLTLVRDAAIQHLSLLEEGVVPESNFWPSVQKYEYARILMTALDLLGEDSPGDADETVEVQREDLEALVLFAREFTTEAGRQPGSPLGNLTEAVYPEGIDPAEEPQE